MSDTLTPSGLQSSAGLYGSCGVYQFDRNGAIFNPLDLNPYLLFDAESSMIGTLENPTLDLDPTKQESLDVITATRAGTATFVNLDGEIEIAQPNTVRVDNSLGYPAILIEPSSENLITNSNFGGWIVQSNTTLTSNTTETLSPDGTNNATKMTSNGSEGLYVASLGTASLNTKSVFLKGVSGGEQVILQDPHQNIDPLTCTLTTEWQRFHLTQTQTGSFGLWLTNIPASGIYAFGAQVETGSLTSYIPTTGSTAQRAKDDLSIDPDSTNLVTHSDFSGGWQEYLINSSAGSGYSLNASRVITSTGANAAYYIPVPTSNGATYTASIWARRVSGSGGCNIIYLSSPTAKQSISLTSEFQKFTATFTGKSGGGNVNFGVDIVTSGDSIEIAMPQVELGSSPTGFILTSGAAASRTAFSDFYNQSEGTFYVETTIAQPEKQYAILRGGSTNQLFIYSNNDRNHLFYDGNPTTNFGLVTANQLSRFALSYKSGNITASLNGSQNTGTPSGLLASSTKLEIGTGYNPDFNGHIKRVIYWPYHSDSL